MTTIKYLAIGTVVVIGFDQLCGMRGVGEPQSGGRSGAARTAFNWPADGSAKTGGSMTDSGGEQLFYSFQGHRYYFPTNAFGGW